jgi:hypothetical protein
MSADFMMSKVRYGLFHGPCQITQAHAQTIVVNGVIIINPPRDFGLPSQLYPGV